MSNCRMVSKKEAKRIRCLCHTIKACKSKSRAFSKNSWRVFRNAARIRDDKIYDKYSTLLEGDEPIGQYHPECYKKYTNKDHLERLKIEDIVQGSEHSLLKHVSHQPREADAPVWKKQYQ